MCGIAGIYVPRHGPAVDRRLLEAMTDRLTHRGPDDNGYLVEAGVGLGFRRLSIIDLAGGHQPIFNEAGDVAVVFNGEIYNFQELRRTLEGRGHRFRTRADSEVLPHGWEEWGEALVPRLRGMFAFAVWDRRRHLLFLARDRLGIKPLYYAAMPDGRVLFGSEMKALLADPALSRRFDPRAVEEYLSLGYVPDPRSILESVAKLPPAHTLTLAEGSPPAPRAYWSVAFEPDPSLARSPAAEEELLARLDDAVESRLVADVPLGAFLSGGIDSSAVVSSMARARGDGLHTCSISFGEARYDESEFARLVSRQLHTSHHEERAEPDSFRLLDQLVAAYDEPFSDNSALPTYLLCRLARQRVTVALSGDGGDETLAGYQRYARFLSAAALHRAVPRPIPAPALTAMAAVAERMIRGPRAAVRGDSLRALAGDLAEAYERLVGVSRREQRLRLYSPAFRSALQEYDALECLREHFQAAPADDPLSRAQYVDLKTYLPGEILTKVDRASMAHSLEVRVPLLDHLWVEWTARLPASAKMERGVGKAIFRRALRDRLPAVVLERPKKGFTIPVAGWLRGPLRGALEERLLGPGPGEAGILEPAELRRIVGQHLEGAQDHAALLWSLWMLQASWEHLRRL